MNKVSMVIKNGPRPVGYEVQKNFPCCANCYFGGFLGEVEDAARVCVCEILGEPEDSDYHAIATEPLGKCKAWQPNIGDI